MLFLSTVAAMGNDNTNFFDSSHEVALEMGIGGKEPQGDSRYIRKQYNDGRIHVLSIAENSPI